MPETDSEYLTRVTERVVQMFEAYVRTVNPNDQAFRAFIREYLAENGVKQPQAISYLKLYTMIREGIRQYLKQEKSRKKK